MARMIAQMLLSASMRLTLLKICSACSRTCRGEEVSQSCERAPCSCSLSPFCWVGTAASGEGAPAYCTGGESSCGGAWPLERPKSCRRRGHQVCKSYERAAGQARTHSAQEASLLLGRTACAITLIESRIGKWLLGSGGGGGADRRELIGLRFELP